jgi:hypothetical protein
VILSLGGFLPNTLAGTIVGRITAPTVAAADFEIKALLFIFYKV